LDEKSYFGRKISSFGITCLNKCISRFLVFNLLFIPLQPENFKNKRLKNYLAKQ